jgi:hypothetical protein
MMQHETLHSKITISIAYQLRGAECTSSAKVLQNILPLTGSIFLIKCVSSSLIILSVIQSIWSRREATVIGTVLLSMALSMVPCTRISLFFCETEREGVERERGDKERLCEVVVKVTDSKRRAVGVFPQERYSMLKTAQETAESSSTPLNTIHTGSSKRTEFHTRSSTVQCSTVHFRTVQYNDVHTLSSDFIFS